MADRTPAQTLAAAADKLEDRLLANGYDQLEATDGVGVVTFGPATLPALAAVLRYNVSIAAVLGDSMDPTALDLANAILGDTS